MSKKISTKDIKVGGGTSKTLQPGNAIVKINSIELEELSFVEGAIHIIMNMESEPIDGLEGFLVDKDNPTGPRYAGQVGRVKAHEWAYADGETKTGRTVNRDEDMLKFLKSLCITLDCVEWLESQDGKHDTIESLIRAFDASGVYKDKYLSVCLAGKEYVNKSGFTNYDLFFPRYSKVGSPYSSHPYDPRKGKPVLEFDETIHIKRKKSEEIEDFGDDTEEKKEDDFSL